MVGVDRNIELAHYFTFFSGMTENPNNNANVFDPTEGNAARVRLGSVGQSAPGCQTRLHLQVKMMIYKISTIKFMLGPS